MKTNRKFNKEVTDRLTLAFLGGDILSIDQIVDLYLGTPSTELSRRIWRQRAMGWISVCKRKVRKQKEFLGIVEETEDGNFYGIVNSAKSARVVLHRYYTLTRGILNNVSVLHRTVQSKKLLKGEVRNTPLYLPVLRGDK